MKNKQRKPKPKLTDMKHQLFLKNFWTENIELINKDDRFTKFCTVFDLKKNITNYQLYSCYFISLLNNSVKQPTK